MWIWTETKKNNPKHDVSKIFTVFFLSILWIYKLYSAYDTILSKFAIQNDEIFGGFWLGSKSSMYKHRLFITKKKNNIMEIKKKSVYWIKLILFGK